jgi:hypothetical protein
MLKNMAYRGSVGWFRPFLYRLAFLQIQFQSNVERNAGWKDLRGFEQIDAMDVWFSIFWQMRP